MNANRRLQERKLPERIVLCKLGGEESSSVMNLSEDGLCFESLKPMEKTGVLQLRLSAGVNGEIETTGRLAWIDSAKRTGGLRFLELTVPARDQIRAWLSETSTSSSESSGGAFLQKLDKQTVDGALLGKSAIDKPVIWTEVRVPGIQLVPIERHRAQKRRQFLTGVLVGFSICAALLIPIFRYAGGAKSGSLPETSTSANRVAHSSAQQTQASAVQSAPSAPISKSFGAKPLAAEPPFGASQAAIALTPDDSKAPSSSGQLETQVQRPKNVRPTPQQLWSALQAGNVKAAVALADLYARGEGVPVNCQQARVLLLAASEKNNPEAIRKLQQLDKGGCPANNDTQ